MELMFKFFQGITKDSESKSLNPSDKDKEELKEKKKKIKPLNSINENKELLEILEVLFFFPY